MRVLQYVPALRELGISVEVSPLFSNDYLRRMYSGDRQSMSDVGRSYAARVKSLLSSGAADVVWVQKEALPFVPSVVERLLESGRPTVFDIDDAWHLRYREHRSAVVRRVLGNKISEAMRAAHVVVAGNSHLAEVARASGATRIEVIPSVVPEATYWRSIVRSEDGPLRLGWIGSPSTVHYLEDLRPVLEQFGRAHPITLRVIGAPFRSGSNFAVESVPWSEATEAASLADIDVGLMPLRSTAWELGKCAYKLVQYMAAGKPVVASDVGANRDVVIPGTTGYLIREPSEWATALEALSDDATRGRMGTAALDRFRASLSVEAQAPKVAACLRAAAEEKS